MPPRKNRNGAEPMMTRRILLTALISLAPSLIGTRQARAESADLAADFIDKLLRDLTTIVNGSGAIEDKRAALEKVVDGTVDVTAVARFCLGRYWRMASAAQQGEYIDLFRRVLVSNVTGKVGEYQGVTFTVGRSTPRDDEFAVATVVTRPGNAPNKVDWLVSMAGGSPKIVDLIAEGTSLRLTRRSDYAAYLARNNNNVQALIEAMRQQANNPQG
jgi:phospholipid transport system substrate-binding protein